MRLIDLRAAAAAVLALSLPGLAAADPFTVSGVKVDETAGTAIAAQDAAFAEGQARAAQMMVDRLTLEEDRDEYGMDSIDPGRAREMITGMSVSDEQRSADRYIASLTVDFDPSMARNLLRGRGIPFVEAVDRPTLVVPVVQGASGNRIWETAWQEAWLEGGFEHYLTPFVTVGQGAPEGQAPGEDWFTPGDALSLDEEALSDLAAEYGVDRVAIIAGRERDGGFNSTGIILDFDPDLPEADDEEGEAELEAELDRRAIRNGVERIDLGTVQGEASWAALAERIATDHQTAYKQANIVRGGAGDEIAVTFLFSTLSEWRSLQEAVAGATLVQNARLDAVSRTGAVMTLSFRGTPEQLERELSNRGARLDEDDEMGWTIRTRRRG